MYSNQSLFGSASDLFGSIDNTQTLRNVSEMLKGIDLPLTTAKGSAYTKEQSMTVFVARQLIAEVKRAIRVVGDKDKNFGEILNFIFFEKNDDSNQTDVSFYVSHDISDRTYYRWRKKALVMFAKEFNAGELLAFEKKQIRS